MYIGKRVKELRQERGLKLIELAKKSKIQLATLSRIEHLRMTGTLDCHMALAKALDVELFELYRDIVTEEEKTKLTTNRNVNDFFVYNDKASHQILTTNVLSKKMMPILINLEPGGRTNKEENKSGTEKFLYVLEGKIQVKLAKETFTVSKTNTLYFNASQEHVFINIGKSRARAICVGTPLYF